MGEWGSTCEEVDTDFNEKESVDKHVHVDRRHEPAVPLRISEVRIAVHAFGSGILEGERNWKGGEMA